MTTINLKRYYPYMTENVMLEVSDEIAAALSMGGRLCDSYKRQKRRNGECSLDTDPGFEADVLHQPLTPDEYIEARETTFALYDALAQLPSTAGPACVPALSSRHEQGRDRGSRGRWPEPHLLLH